VSELTRAAELDPTVAETQYALARVYRRLGQSARADEALSAFLRLRESRSQSRP
jgi:Flp pilus assembly protein TadD